MRISRLYKLFFSLPFLLASLLTGVDTIAQEVYFETKFEAVENTPLILRGQVYTLNPLSTLLFGYRISGETEYIITEAEFTGNEFTLKIPASDVQAPGIEFFMQYSDTKGKSGYFPEDFQEIELPAKILVTTRPPYYDSVIMLNPIDETAILDKDYFISFSLFKLPDEIDKKATRMIINGEDVTSNSLVTEDIISFYHILNTDVIKPGNINVALQFFNTNGSPAFTKTVQLTARGESGKELAEDNFFYRANFQAEGRNENYSGSNGWYNNLSGAFDGTYNDIGIESRFYLTSEDKSYRQPQNRFFAGLRTDYGSLELGDHVPDYPSLIYSGKRLRGITGNLELGFFELKLSYGQINRATEGRLLELFPGNDTPLDADVIRVDSATFGAEFARVVKGDYQRNLFIIRPSFNFSSNSRFGFTYLHSIDDKESIRFGTQPKENLAFGPDFKITFDRRRVTFNANAYVSLQNQDISEGTIPDSLIEDFLEENDIFDGDPDELNRYKNIVSKFITVNQYLGPFNIAELASLASDIELKLDYFNNSIKAAYIYRGNDYTSFGKPFVRKDIAGVSFYDRLRLMSNKMFVNFSFENLHDNLQKTKFNTTNIRNMNVSLSWFPRSEYPDITAGYKYNFNKNDVNPLDSANVPYLIDDFTGSYFLQSAITIFTPVKHNIMFRISVSNRDDKSYRDYDNKVLNSSISVGSRWSDLFQTYAGISFNNSESPASKFNYTRLTLTGRWWLFEKRLELNAKISPSFGSLRRTGLEVYGDYFYTKRITISYQLRYFTNFENIGSSIAGITFKYSI